MVKNLAANLERCIGSLGLEDTLERCTGSLGLKDTLEKEMATHSRIFAWEIPWTEEPDGLQSIGSQKLDTT